MIPYFVVPPLHLGPVTIQPFGVLSAAGVWLASWLLVRTAQRSGLDPEPGERRHQLRQKPRPLGDLDPQQVDHDVLFGITEKLETFTQPRWGFGVAQYDDTGEFGILTLGVEHPTARRPVWQKLNRAAR